VGRTIPIEHIYVRGEYGRGQVVVCGTNMADKQVPEVDIEGQHDPSSQEFNYENELRRVRSASAVTISPELFERVCRLLCELGLTNSYTSLPKYRLPVISGNALQILLPWGSWGIFNSLPVISRKIRNSNGHLLDGNYGMGRSHLFDCCRVPIPASPLLK
jgi:hypothetical protein